MRIDDMQKLTKLEWKYTEANRREVMALLQEINNLGTTMLVVTHEQHLVNQFGNRVITIDEGLISSDRVRTYEDQ